MKKLVFNGCKVMVYGEVAGSVQGQQQVPLSRRPRFTTLAQWEDYAKKLDAFGAYLKLNGITSAYHHHMGADGESTQDLETLMKLTTDNVGLLFDTGRHHLRRRQRARRTEEAHRPRGARALQGRTRSRDEEGAQQRPELPELSPRRRCSTVGDGMIDF